MGATQNYFATVLNRRTASQRARAAGVTIAVSFDSTDKENMTAAQSCFCRRRGEFR